MKKYFKLDLNNSSFWQKKVEDGEVVYRKENYELKSDSCLNNVFFRKLPNGIYRELITKSILEVNQDDNNINFPKGIDVSLDNFAPTDINEINETLKEIKVKKLSSEYYDIINCLLIKSNLCDTISKRKKQNFLGYARTLELKMQLKHK
ncbi:MAG: hypothetical protein GX758_00240 [Tenericutes bacterium]|nr:hypothetical protein [Mycoplasmatota bacterium]